MMIGPIYDVAPGNTLYSIAQEAYGNGYDWPVIWDANRTRIPNPNWIYPGEQIYIPRHAKPDSQTTSNGGGNSPGNSDSGAANDSLDPSGNLGCAGLEQLWRYNGGNPASAFLAAEIAMAESAGVQYALSPTDDYGYWQINGSHGPQLATFDNNGNARAAIELSDNGRDWEQWTTYRDNLYEGRC